MKYIIDFDGGIGTEGTIHYHVVEQLPSAQFEQLETCPLYGGVCGYPSEKCYECPRHPEKPDHGYMWICPECGLVVHSDFWKCVRCGWERQPETVARDIATILENEQDMRVILKNAESVTYKGEIMSDTIKTERKWTPVWERLPEDEQMYMVTLATKLSDENKVMIGIGSEAAHYVRGKWINDH